MGVLQRFEKRLGDLVEGAFAKVFRGGVEPVEIASALTREADDRKAIGPLRTLIPNDYVVALGESDYERLSPYAVELGGELATLLREHAESEHYSFIGPVTVSFELDPQLDTGIFRVDCSARAADPDPSVPLVDPLLAARAPAGGTAVGGVRAAEGYTAVVPRVAAADPVPAPVDPWVTAGRPRLLRVGSDGTREIRLTSVRTLLGRGTAVDVDLKDSSVSRRHGEITREADGSHTYTDLGSTNGSRLNDAECSQARLADGDRLSLGAATVIFHCEHSAARPHPQRRPDQAPAGPG